MSLFVFQAYTDELVELHRRLMALRERNVLQQVQPLPLLPLLPWGLGVMGLSQALPQRFCFALKAKIQSEK